MILGLKEPWEVRTVHLDVGGQRVEVALGVSARDIVGVPGKPGTAAGA